MEEWRLVPGHWGYSASNLGRIMAPGRPSRDPKRKNHPIPPRILRPKTNSNGYFFVVLRVGLNSYTPKLVSRLVWAAFNGPIPSGLVVDHIDFNPKNDTPENLRVCTQRENISRSAAAGRLFGKLSADDVLAIKRSSGPYSRIGKAFGISRQAVHQIKKGQTHKHVLDPLDALSDFE